MSLIGLPPVMNGPRAITEFLTFLHDKLYPGFSFEDVDIHIETPEQAFAEYHIHHKSGISGKDIKQQFFGHLEAADGKIKRLREAIDVVVAAEAIYPNVPPTSSRQKLEIQNLRRHAWPPSPAPHSSPG